MEIDDLTKGTSGEGEVELDIRSEWCGTEEADLGAWVGVDVCAAGAQASLETCV